MVFEAASTFPAQMAGNRTSSQYGMIFLMATITWRVEELAARRGWTVRQLAEAAGLDQKTVRNILTGRASRVDLDTIERLSRALEVRPGALWRVEPDPSRAWKKSAGAAGSARANELEDVLAGRWCWDTDPALERAARP
jgi:DNA-binding Xre family transcriptional regulator